MLQDGNVQEDMHRILWVVKFVILPLRQRQGLPEVPLASGDAGGEARSPVDCTSAYGLPARGGTYRAVS
jgi:hypothetical protein